ncbi:MAG: TetR family transcriptional regulator [Dehalococcoidia bacterium]|nr:TetR family transcriptional regulator [Dehalococcoidia bacterium]
MSTATFFRYALAVADRPYHHGNLRPALLAQAEHTLREQGLDGLALRELARQVGVSHAAPRRHFADRQALLDALAESGWARLEAEVRAAVESAGEDYEARLRASGQAYVRFATRDAALLELMFASRQGRQVATLQEATAGAFSVLVELVQDGQASGVVEPGDPQRMALLLFATVQGIAALANAGIIAPKRLDPLVAEAIGRFLHGQPTLA